MRNGLIRFGIDPRAAHKPHGRPSQPRFGQRMVHGAAATNQTEQRVIKAILELKAQGMGFRQIARTMTQLKIPTKCRGKAWHPQMVARILTSEGR